MTRLRIRIELNRGGVGVPLHKLASALRDYFDSCKRDVVWDVVKGADHEREASALDSKKATTILDWVLAH